MAQKPKKVPISPERAFLITSSADLIALLAEVIKIEHQQVLYDTGFRQAWLKERANRIKDSAILIQSEVNKDFHLEDKEGFVYQNALQMHRLIRFYKSWGFERIEEYMDLVDKNKKLQDSLHVKPPVTENQLSLL